MSMKTLVSRKPDVRERALAGATAGVIAVGVFMLEQEMDLRLFRHNADDLAMLGRLLTRDATWIRPIGFGLHLVYGAAAGVAYAVLAQDRLPGPPWARGTIAALIENMTVYPLALLEDHHPGVREGSIASYRTPAAFVQAAFRHIAFGAVLGVLTERFLHQGR
jgi:hypothetical protein